MVGDTRIRTVELMPVSEASVEVVADLQVTGPKKVVGEAKGVVASGNSGLRNDLYAAAVEAALAADSSKPDVLVAPTYFETFAEDEEKNTVMTVTVVGYPARYTKFRRDEPHPNSAAPFVVRQLPGGATVVSYDKGGYIAKLTGDNLITIQSVGNRSAEAPAAPPAPTGQTGE
jgi:hypothetical protein